MLLGFSLQKLVKQLAIVSDEGNSRDDGKRLIELNMSSGFRVGNNEIALKPLIKALGRNNCANLVLGYKS